MTKDATFWVMDSLHFDDVSFGKAVDSNFFASDMVPIFRAEAPAPDPLDIKLIKDKKTDVIWILGGICFRKNIIEELQANHATGWESFPIVINKRNERIEHQWFGLIITSATVKADSKKPSAVYFDRSTWDGSDIFLSDIDQRILITKKVRDIFKKNKFSGVQFKMRAKFLR